MCLWLGVRWWRAKRSMFGWFHVSKNFYVNIYLSIPMPRMSRSLPPESLSRPTPEEQVMTRPCRNESFVPIDYLMYLT